MALNGKKAIMITFVVQLILFILGSGSVYAAPVPQVAPAPGMELKDLQESRQPPVLKPDLKCTITAYYDHATTRPIVNGIWNLSDPANAVTNNYYVIWYKLSMKNVGYAKAQDAEIKMGFLFPDGHHVLRTLTRTLDQGETLEFLQPHGFTQSDAQGKMAGLVTRLDAAYNIIELREDNNLCTTYVYFKKP